ncbi:ribokinase [Malassezia cuniculi]|uniref:Ribokinase n=1 Tax=Malassezia cuniculi TaxID=948313 RepID=A0AAF0J702_9BASI|nr:ribokinase [Malassezia cuniculi]
MYHQFPGVIVPLCLVRSSINIDESFQVPHIVKPGETISSTGLISRAGGKGANVAAAIALAGARVRMLGSVGSDATWPISELRKRDVDVNFVRVSNTQPTGRAFIQIAEDGENSIVLVKGANHEQDYSLDSPASWLAHATHLMLQNEIPFSTTAAYAQYALTLKDSANDKRVFTVFNPSPMLNADEIKQFPWAAVDALIINDGEAQELLAAFGTTAVPGDAASALGDLDALSRTSWIVVTHGAKGVTAAIKLDPASDTEREVIELPAVRTKARDTTGAGDTFAGYLVAGLMEVHADRSAVGSRIKRAEAEAILRAATVAAAIAVESEGAMESIPDGKNVSARPRNVPAVPLPTVVDSKPYTSPTKSTDAQCSPPPSPTLATRKCGRAAALNAAALPQHALYALKTRRTLGARVAPVDTTSYLDSFSSDPDAYYIVESACVDHAAASMLSSAYTHSAVCGGAQCLAVGDDEGRVHLIDTSVAPRSLADSAVKLSTRPLVDGSIFELQWRFDDRVLGVGSSDYAVSAWDVEHELCVARYDAHGGSPRTLAWDPHGAGRLLASGGRDGSIYLWDLRLESPAVHIAGAHGRLTGGRRGRALTAGVTSLAYVDGMLASAGCGNSTVKLWDMRMISKRPKPRAESTGLSQGAHGISSLAVCTAQSRIYAACTNGCVYGLRTSMDGDTVTLYDEAQASNTLYARMSLYNDRFLAVGCNTGDVTLWDTAHPLQR